MKQTLNEATKAAIETVERLLPPQPADPWKSPKYVALKQLHEMNIETLKHAISAEAMVHKMVMTARKAHAETLVRMELLEEELGLTVEPEEDSEHA